ncbi:MAG: hypothetical protein JNJ54_33000 [Myxococcaceae bacterium]|nr:hypothetical protein [Myxococcaceae bacterium]
MDDASVRVRLEGRAELLDATLLRYRVLVNALKSWRWKARLRANVVVFQEVARAQDAVDEALAHVLKRGHAEEWDPRAGVMATRAQVESLRAELLALISRRLDSPLDDQSLRPGIEALETQVLTAPRLVLPGQRWSTAVEVLPPNVPELQRAVWFGKRAEALFGRPMQGPARLPMSLDELDEFIEAWPDGVASLDAVWQRLVRIDATGAMVRFLRRRARRSLTSPPKSGPELLLYTEFWRSMAVSKMDQVLNERLAPIVWLEHERFPLLRWLWHREHNLPAKPGLNHEARDALFELASTLVDLPRTSERAPLVLGGLIPIARAADRLRATEDWVRLHDELRLLVRVVWAPRRVRAPEPQDTLEDLVRALRDSG